MGQSGFKSLCGKNLGYFPETVDSPTNSDDEEEDVDSEAERHMPKGYREAMKKDKNKDHLFNKLKMKRATIDAGAVGRGWGPYLIQVEVGGIRLPGIRAQKARISGPMLEKLKAIGSLHTLEITHCHLKEMPPVNHVDDLVVLQLSHNSIRIMHNEDSEGTMKASKLEKFICDWNKLDTIGPCVFSGSLASNLTAINLAHNDLTFLPRDFGQGASKLVYLDLSYNKLTQLPDDLATSCRKLELLYVQRNELRSIPRDIGSLKELRKLFLSHNKLKEVPESIGNCTRLEKVRLIANDIRYLPDSFIKLWRNKEHGFDGRLDELLVDGNPLVQPSITAFEIGGLEQAMKLFHEWLQDKQQAKEEADALALEGPRGQVAQEASARASRPSPLDLARVGADSGPGGSDGQLALTAGSSAGAEPSRGAEVAASPSDDTRDEDHTNSMDLAQHYYFSYVTAGSYEISEVRNAESKLLLRKKSMYIENQIKVARDMQRKAHQFHTAVPAHMQEFLGTPDKPFESVRYSGKIPVTDLDLYFNLLVFSTRPMFSSVQMLFDKFHTEASSSSRITDASLSNQEWNNLCNRVPVKLPQDVKDEMWNLLSASVGPIKSIKFVDFVAGWHIHDIEHQDPFIRRVAEVQKLDYYDMDVAEMQERLKARGATEATMPLAFEGPSARKASHEVALPAMEGERRVQDRDRGEEGQNARGRAKKPGDGDQAKKPQISMTNAQYVEHDSSDDKEDDQGDVNVMDSDVLSRDEDSDISLFDAATIQAELEKDNAALENGAGPAETEDTFGILDAASESPTPKGDMRFKAKAKTKSKTRRKKKMDGPSGGRAKDARFRTDVFEVRVALREAHRNLPFEDFKKLVNFMIRGMKRILDFTNHITYWHADDPSFRYATGVGSMHNYSLNLLRSMGFVLVADTYWVWPEKHLSTSYDWGHESVPPECPGLSNHRLTDMVKLFKACQKGLSTDGKNFQGHFP
mmetsp:Transcript_46379/g.132722  ORF Transcript_46379/g.132722 Transcript_46379/m.132722 type:complete len:976 (+) Transcript_46379:105-3032(+)